MPASRKTNSQRHVFGPGEVIFREGERGVAGYVIQRGRVNVTRQEAGELTQLASLGPGEIVGEMALMKDARRGATATAEEETELLVIDRDLLRRRLSRADPMLRLLVRALLDRMRDFASPTAEDVTTGPAAWPGVGRRPGQMERRAFGQITFEHELRQALANGEFEILLQPIVDLRERRTRGFEALMTWRHPSRGQLSPASFIAIAERSGLIRNLDDLALRLALRALKRLNQVRNGRRTPLQISVNLSGVHAEDAETVGRVRAILSEEDIEPGVVTLEITESWLVSDPDAAQGVLSGLKDLGLHLALDDFGTGYSSLAYLHRFPIDYLKVDRSFTQTMLVSAGSTNIVHAVIALAHALGLQTVAEGIDDAAQIPVLRQMRCEFGQGYHFSPPLRVAQACAYIEREGRRRRPGRRQAGRGRATPEAE